MIIETTDDELAKLIADQTYRDRMDLAQWLVAEITEILANNHSEYRITDTDMAVLLGQWADQILTDE